MKGTPSANLVIVIPQQVRCTGEQRFQPRLAIDQGEHHQVFPIQKQQVEQEEDQQSLAGITGVLDQVESRSAVWEDAAKLAVQIGILRR